MIKPKYEFVAVDFDGTLCTDAFPEIGKPKPLVIGYVKKLAAEGSKIILHTCRENGTRLLLDEAVAFCEAQGIPLFAVNENPGNLHPTRYGLSHADGRKVYADLYIDNKAVNTAEIERKRGKWIEHIDPYENYCECSLCHKRPDSPLDTTPYCPYCGSEMEVEQ